MGSRMGPGMGPKMGPGMNPGTEQGMWLGMGLSIGITHSATSDLCMKVISILIHITYLGTFEKYIFIRIRHTILYFIFHHL